MKVEVLYVTEREKMSIQILEKGQFDKLPEPGIYTVFFEKVEEQKVPEFNQ